MLKRAEAARQLEGIGAGLAFPPTGCLQPGEHRALRALSKPNRWWLLPAWGRAGQQRRHPLRYLAESDGAGLCHRRRVSPPTCCTVADVRTFIPPDAKNHWGASSTSRVARAPCTAWVARRPLTASPKSRLNALTIKLVRLSPATASSSTPSAGMGAHRYGRRRRAEAWAGAASSGRWTAG